MSANRRLVNQDLIIIYMKNDMGSVDEKCRKVITATHYHQLKYISWQPYFLVASHYYNIIINISSSAAHAKPFGKDFLGIADNDACNTEWELTFSHTK